MKKINTPNRSLGLVEHILDNDNQFAQISKLSSIRQYLNILNVYYYWISDITYVMFLDVVNHFTEHFQASHYTHTAIGPENFRVYLQAYLNSQITSDVLSKGLY